MFHKRILTRRDKFLLLSLIPVYFIVCGFILQPFSEIWPGIATLIKEPDFLITDYFVVGGGGGAFFKEDLRSHASQYCPYLFSGYGDGRTYYHVRLPDVWIFPVWKKSVQYLGDYAGYLALRQIS